MGLLSVTPSEHVTFRVAYADDHLLVIDKRSGLATQPGKGHQDDTLLNGLFAAHGPRLQNLGAARDFGLLHRLDRDTSGLLVVGLSVRAYDALREAFAGRSVRKFYWAVCARAPKQPRGVLSLPIAETLPARDRPKLARVIHGGAGRTRVPGAKPALTAYRVLQTAAGGAALLEARPLTGRLHQVRVHLEAIGCPILGDRFYAPHGPRDAAPRLALHSHRLAFTHPVTGAPIDVRAPWPKDLRALLRRLGLERPDLARAGAPGAPEDEPD
ncbi:MAG TPA: RluA family pseudouridine synthase [Phycisphaerales bacterium]|nr:RluA family pseudouridine synthase [Phycisphaerales bacterium]